MFSGIFMFEFEPILDSSIDSNNVKEVQLNSK